MAKWQKQYVSDDFNKIILCDKYGWTEKQYESNSHEFIKLLQAKNEIDRINQRKNKI